MDDGSPHEVGRQGGSFELKEHTADVAVEAIGPSLAAVFAALADGLAAASADEIPDGLGNRFEVTETAESSEAVLFDYLDRLIYERDVREVLPVENEVAVRRADEDWVVEASARGVPLSAIAAREVKAVTYSEMVIEERDGEWYGYVVFDV